MFEPYGDLNCSQFWSLGGTTLIRNNQEQHNIVDITFTAADTSDAQITLHSEVACLKQSNQNLPRSILIGGKNHAGKERAGFIHTCICWPLLKTLVSTKAPLLAGSATRTLPKFG